MIEYVRQFGAGINHLIGNLSQSDRFRNQTINSQRSSNQIRIAAGYRVIELFKRRDKINFQRIENFENLAFDVIEFLRVGEYGVIKLAELRCGVFRAAESVDQGGLSIQPKTAHFFRRLLGCVAEHFSCGLQYGKLRVQPGQRIA